MPTDPWKKFSEVIRFLYDNEGVVKSLQNRLSKESFLMKATLKGQIEEVQKLILHHQKELLSFAEEAKKAASQKGIDTQEVFEGLKRAIEKLDPVEIEKELELFKEVCERGDSNP